MDRRRGVSPQPARRTRRVLRLPARHWWRPQPEGARHRHGAEPVLLIRVSSLLLRPWSADRARRHEVDRLAGWIERDMRLAASKLHEHLRDLGLERRLVQAIVGALTQHERLDHRSQRVRFQIVWRDSDRGDLLATVLPFKSFDRGLVLVLHASTRYTMAVARVGSPQASRAGVAARNPSTSS